VFTAMRQPRGGVTARVARTEAPARIPSLESHFGKQY